jgi:hypothetical protein
VDLGVRGGRDELVPSSAGTLFISLNHAGTWLLRLEVELFSNLLQQVILMIFVFFKLLHSPVLLG